MEYLAVITVLNPIDSGSFGKNFVKFKKKIKMLLSSLGRFVLGKSVPSVLSINTDLPVGEWHIFTTYISLKS